MKLKNVAAAGFGAAILSVALAGCSLIPQPAAPPAAPTATDKPVVKETEKPAETEKPSTDAGGESVLNPGESTKGAGIVPFVNHEDETANFSHQVVSIDKAPSEDMAELLAEIPKLKGMDVYYINIDSHYVDGANLEFNSFSTSFKPVDADGDEAQEISLIGWDNCESGSIPKGGTDPSVTISNCVAAAVPGGQPAPSGVMWNQYDTPYDKYDGAPALFLLG